MAESKTHNFAIQGPTEKKKSSLIFCTDATIKFQVLSSSASLFLQPTALLYW